MSRKIVAAVALTCLAATGVGLGALARHQAKKGPQAPSPVASLAASMRPVAAPPTEDFVGVLVPLKTVNLATRIDGKLAKVTAELGAVVHEGDLLAALDAKLGKHELAMARAGYDAASAAKSAARVELDRARDRTSRRRDGAVGAGGRSLALVSGEEAAQAKFDESSGAAKLRASSASAVQEQTHVAQAATLLEQHELRAPFDGVVAARYLDQGAYVRAGDPVVRIVSAGAMLVRFAVPEERIAGLKAGDPVTVQLDGTSFEARIARLSPEVEPSSRTVFVEASPFAASGLCSDGCTGLAGRVIRVAVVRKDEPNPR